MEEMKRDKSRRSYTLIGILGTISIALLMLIGVAGAAPFAYVTNCASNNVYVIDTATDTVTTTIDVGSSPSGVAVSSDGAKVYVTNYFSNNVSVIDTASNTVTATVNVGANPYGIAVNPAGTKVYVANFKGNSISVIDTVTNSVISTVKVGSLPQGVAVTPDGAKVYVANRDSGTVSVIDTATNTIIASVNVGTGPLGVAVNPSGSKVYVTNYNSFTVSSIDTVTNKVIVTVNVGEGPWGVAVNPEGTRIYVTNQANGTVSVIDASTNTVIATVKVEGSPYGVSVNPEGTKVYVANYNSNNLPIIDTTTNTIIATVNVGNWPVAFGQFISPLPSQPILPVANFSSNVTYGYVPLSVQFTDLSTNATSWSWDFGDGAFSTDKNTTHTYSAAGTYTVNLTATNENGTDSKLATITVLKSTPIITWNNPADIIAGTALSSTQLNAVAKDPVSGATIDGIFTYTPAAGTVLNEGTGQTLHVDFTPTDTANYTAALKEIKVNVLEKPAIPVADFSASPTTGKASLAVTFTDKSTGSPTSWSWNFGDKSTSIDQSPVHTYSKAGKYTVSLTVKNALGTNTRKITNYIIVKK